MQVRQTVAAAALADPIAGLVMSPARKRCTETARFGYPCVAKPAACCAKGQTFAAGDAGDDVLMITEI